MFKFRQLALFGIVLLAQPFSLVVAADGLGAAASAAGVDNDLARARIILSEPGIFTYGKGTLDGIIQYLKSHSREQDGILLERLRKNNMADFRPIYLAASRDASAPSHRLSSRSGSTGLGGAAVHGASAAAAGAGAGHRSFSRSGSAAVSAAQPICACQETSGIQKYIKRDASGLPLDGFPPIYICDDCTRSDAKAAAYTDFGRRIPEGYFYVMCNTPNCGEYKDLKTFRKHSEWGDMVFGEPVLHFCQTCIQANRHQHQGDGGRPLIPQGYFEVSSTAAASAHPAAAAAASAPSASAHPAASSHRSSSRSGSAGRPATAAGHSGHGAATAPRRLSPSTRSGSAGRGSAAAAAGAPHRPALGGAAPIPVDAKCCVCGIINNSWTGGQLVQYRLMDGVRPRAGVAPIYFCEGCERCENVTSQTSSATIIPPGYSPCSSY